MLRSHSFVRLQKHLLPVRNISLAVSPWRFIAEDCAFFLFKNFIFVDSSQMSNLRGAFFFSRPILPPTKKLIPKIMARDRYIVAKEHLIFVFYPYKCFFSTLNLTFDVLCRCINPVSLNKPDHVNVIVVATVQINDSAVCLSGPINV